MFCLVPSAVAKFSAWNYLLEFAGACTPPLVCFLLSRLRWNRPVKGKYLAKERETN